MPGEKIWRTSDEIDEMLMSLTSEFRFDRSVSVVFSDGSVVDVEVSWVDRFFSIVFSYRGQFCSKKFERR